MDKQLEILEKMTTNEELLKFVDDLSKDPIKKADFFRGLSPEADELFCEKLKAAKEPKTPSPPPKVVMTEAPKPPVEPPPPPSKNKGEQNLAEKLQKANWEIERLKDDNKELKDQVSRYKNAEIARDQHIKNLEFDLNKLARDVDKYRNKTYNLTKKLMKMPGSELPDFDV